MTSLSNVFRATQLTTPKKIAVKELNQQILEEVAESSLSLDAVYAERDQVLREARSQLAADREEIDALRQQAHEEVAAMQRAWQEERIQLEQQAYETGYQAGFNEGQQRVQAEMAEALAQANQIATTSLENAHAYQASQERVILEIAMAATERIVGEAIEENEERFISIIRRAIKEVREMNEVKLYVSSRYYELVSKHRDEFAALFPPNVPFLLFVNESFEDTESYIETNHGRVVVTVDDQLMELREQLIEFVESRD